MNARPGPRLPSPAPPVDALLGSLQAVAAGGGEAGDAPGDAALLRRAAAAMAALARTVTVEDVVGCVDTVLLRLVGARSCAVYLEPAGAESAGHQRLPLMFSAGHVGALEPVHEPDSAVRGSRGRLTLPLTAAGRTVGSWQLVGLDGVAPEGSAERAVLETIAAQFAQALARARLLEQSRSTSRLLQRALLPERLQPIAGLDVAARYRCGDGADVGGDWYDVLHLPDDGVGLVLGDVMGRGVRAAATMAQVRNALRGIAVLEAAPAGMLGALDRFFEAFDPDEITTLVITVIDPGTGTLHVGNAGHLPPLLLRADGRSGYLDDGASTPLGVPTARVACKGTRLLPGDLLVMCSDGLVERRDRSLADGLDVLETAARRLVEQVTDLEQLADALLREVLGGEESDDDVSLLLVRLPA